MWYFIEMTEEAYERAKNGERVEGVIRQVEGKSDLVFKAWNRRAPKNPPMNVVCHTPNGTMWETQNRYRLNINVKKKVGPIIVKKVMVEETEYATNSLIQKSELKSTEL
jgi:hypothetical protein